MEVTQIKTLLKYGQLNPLGPQEEILWIHIKWDVEKRPIQEKMSNEKCIFCVNKHKQADLSAKKTLRW